LPLAEGRERYATLYLIYADADTAGPGRVGSARSCVPGSRSPADPRSEVLWTGVAERCRSRAVASIL